MVAISLYKGNLHKVSDVPRQWEMPQPKISLKDFRTLLHRRNRSLSRQLSSAAAATTTTVTTTVSDNPNPNPHPNSDAGNHDAETPQLKAKEEKAEEKNPVAKADVDEEAVEGTGEEKGSEGVNGLGKLEAEVADSVANEIKHDADDHNAVVKNEVKNVMEDDQVKMEEKTEGEIPMNPNIEIQESNKEDVESSKDKRKKEVEEKLHILNEKKHGLVQVLKQILSAEEELKRRSMQGMAGRSSVPLHVDIPNDTGSMTRLNTPRMGSDGILIGEVEGGEPDGMSNQNTDSQHLLRLSSQSPSSDYHHKKPANNVIPHFARTTQGIGSPPSRFAPTPTAQQGHPSNLPTVSVSGTNYVASSPSPAASGGTSVFRESRIPSPWN